MPEADRSLWSRGYLASHLLVTRGAGYGLNGVTCLRELSIVAIVNLSKEAALVIANFWLAVRVPADGPRPACPAGRGRRPGAFVSDSVIANFWLAARVPADGPRPACPAGR